MLIVFACGSSAFFVPLHAQSNMAKHNQKQSRSVNLFSGAYFRRNDNRRWVAASFLHRVRHEFDAGNAVFFVCNAPRLKAFKEIIVAFCCCEYVANDAVNEFDGRSAQNFVCQPLQCLCRDCVSNVLSHQLRWNFSSNRQNLRDAMFSRFLGHVDAGDTRLLHRRKSLAREAFCGNLHRLSEAIGEQELKEEGGARKLEVLNAILLSRQPTQKLWRVRSRKLSLCLVHNPS